jgi:hypothetical protein
MHWNSDESKQEAELGIRMGFDLIKLVRIVWQISNSKVQNVMIIN